MDVLFLVAAASAVFCSLMVVSRRNPIYSAAWMMGALASVAVVFALLQATFLAVIQVLLYAGAIMVLFLFVIMLLNPTPADLAREDVPAGQRVLATALAAVLLGVLGWVFLGGEPAAAPPFADRPAPVGFGDTAYFGSTIYDEYLVAFELISLVILAAIAAVVLVGKRRLLIGGIEARAERERQLAQARARAASGPEGRGAERTAAEEEPVHAH
ncbi:MAG: hypothetical protein KatS3mg102_2594 [Planctomycetota bacterium]|nr:MAG: hypothetical protein KatS3mg102_2594 [Planctomycetota bacterium]